MFTETFGKFVYDGDEITCEIDGFKCVADTMHDDDNTPPDKRQEGFWPSLDPKSPGYLGPTATEQDLEAEMIRAVTVMKTWEHDDWDYCGVRVIVYKHDVMLTKSFAHALWGVERNYPNSDNDYLRVVANDLLREALDDARAVLTKLVA